MKGAARKRFLDTAYPRLAGLLVAVLLLTAVVGMMSCSADSPEQPVQLGFAAPDVLSPQAGGVPDEFRADVAVDVKMKLSPNPLTTFRHLSCSQHADVTAVFSGTPALWRGVREGGKVGDFGLDGVLSRWSRVAVGIVPPVEEPRMTDAGGDLAGLAPGRPSDVGQRDTGLAGPKRFRAQPAEKHDLGSEDQQLTLMRGRIRDWARHKAPIVVRFNADWVSRRSFGSCYVRLPRILYSDAADAASAIVAPETAQAGFVSFTGVTAGLTRLNTDGSVVVEQSEPRPSAAGGVETFRAVEDAIWRCSASTGAKALDDLNRQPLSGPSGFDPDRVVGPPVPDKYFRALGRASSCQASVVVSAPQAAWLQALILVFVGIALPGLLKQAAKAIKAHRD